MNKLKKQKGISLIALSITVLVMAVITSTLVYNAKDGYAVRNYKNLENDIEILNSKVSEYYLKNGELPILVKNGQKILYSGNSNYLTQKQPNDGSEYYVIDLTLCGGITLNYGKEFYDVDSIDSTTRLKGDIYIINLQSHRIYYADGVSVNGVMFYTIGEDDAVELHNIQTAP